MNHPLFALYENERMADQAMAKLVAAGIKRRAIQIVTLPEAERDHVGGFGDSGDHAHGAERDHVGGFGDSGDHAHGAERDHVGGFGDSGDHAHGAERDHVGSFAPHKHADDLLRDLVAAGLADNEAHGAVARLNEGAALLLVQADGAHAAQAAAILGG